MSVKQHEAYCLDSQQTQLFFYDDFLGDSVRDLWALSGDGGGTAVPIDAQDGGVLHITTDGDNTDSYGIYWNDTRTLHVDKKVAVETRVKLVQTTLVDVKLQLLRYNVNNRIYFRYDTSVPDTNWVIVTTDGGASTTGDSGVAADTDYHILRIECFPAGEVHFFIDGVETNNSPITTNIPDDAGDYLQPRYYIQTLENATKSLDIDYIIVRQDI